MSDQTQIAVTVSSGTVTLLQGSPIARPSRRRGSAVAVRSGSTQRHECMSKKLQPSVGAGLLGPSPVDRARGEAAAAGAAVGAIVGSLVGGRTGAVIGGAAGAAAGILLSGKTK